jgi:hypothetical protein
VKPARAAYPPSTTSAYPWFEEQLRKP